MKAEANTFGWSAKKEPHKALFLRGAGATLTPNVFVAGSRFLLACQSLIFFSVRCLFFLCCCLSPFCSLGNERSSSSSKLRDLSVCPSSRPLDLIIVCPGGSLSAKGCSPIFSLSLSSSLFVQFFFLSRPPIKTEVAGRITNKQAKRTIATLSLLAVIKLSGCQVVVVSFVRLSLSVEA